MSDKLAFFSRCRPQGSDPIEIVVRERRAFIGYPAWRPGVEPRRGHLRAAVMDLQSSDEEWDAFKANVSSNEGKQYQQNRNFVGAIEVGAIALVPRPNRGLVYAGRVIKRFEMLDDPPWGNEYLRLREKQECGEGSGEFSHLADVAVCCEVDRYRELSFPLIPAWIRSSFFGRSTYGRIKPLWELDLDPHRILDQLLDHPDQVERPWTNELIEIERRLVDGIGPNTFEHLCVALLQLEHPREVWVHVGGSGDDGVDGIGAGVAGNVIGQLQCKWRYDGSAVPIADEGSSDGVRQVLAALIHPPEVYLPDGVEFWSRPQIAGLVLKHATRLPLALSLRIKSG